MSATKKTTRKRSRPGRKLARPKLVSRANAYSIYEHLRELIISGKIGAGATLTQAALARDIGTSRTPIREAMCMLQNEKLIVAEPNNKARVLPCTLDELDAIYANRIFMEPVGIALSIPRMTTEHLALLDQRLKKMASAESKDDFGNWISEHSAFHLDLSFFSGASFRSEIARLLERSARFQHIYRAARPKTWTVHRSRDHRDLVALCKRREPAKAYWLMLHHLADTTVTVEDHFSTEAGRPQGSAVQAAIRIMLQGRGAFDPSAASVAPLTRDLSLSDLDELTSQS